MNMLLKQSATKQISATLSHSISVESVASSSVHQFKSLSYLYRAENNGSPDTGIRKFHSGTKSLEVRESDAITQQYPIEDSVFEEENSISSKKEGLVIAKLGIATEIVSCLAKRGITTLFPIQVGENYRKLAEGITVYSIATENYGKALTLEVLLKEYAKEGKCIVFTQTKHNADRLAYAMSKSVKCKPLHGDISQNQKEKTLSGFRDGRFNILIATDIAARGLDIPNVDLVVHYEMPTTSEIFVHRSSRTGRPGKQGIAVLIHTYEQARAVRGLELDIGCKFTQLLKMTTEGRDGDMFAGFSGGRMSSGRLVGRSPASFGDFGSLSRDSSLSSSGLNNSGFGSSNCRRADGFGSFATKNSSGFERYIENHQTTHVGIVQKPRFSLDEFATFYMSW